jgi:hypothetical protein
MSEGRKETDKVGKREILKSKKIFENTTDENNEDRYIIILHIN